MDGTFKAVTDKLGLPAVEVAEALGLRPQTIRQMRLSSNATNYRTPPEHWRRKLARLARRRSKELAQLANALERDERVVRHDKGHGT